MCMRVGGASASHLWRFRLRFRSNPRLMLRSTLTTLRFIVSECSSVVKGVRRFENSGHGLPAQIAEFGAPFLHAYVLRSWLLGVSCS